MTTTQSQYDEEHTLSPSDYARLAPFAEELRRLARDIDKVIRKRAPLPRCLSGLTAMRPLINLIEESTIKLLACTAEDDEPESTPSLEIDGKQNRDSTPGYL